MVMRALVIGGTGNFGGTILRALAGDTALQLLIGSRDAARAQALAATLPGAEGHAIDITQDLQAAFARIRPDLVIHTSGPFQDQGYSVAEACIAAGAHYLDLADARAFVAGIGALDAAARKAGVLVVAGASSVPCLTAAVIDHYRPGFARLTGIDYGISAAQQTNRGLATTSAILSYMGRPFTTLRDGRERTVHGWHGLHARRYPELGLRLFGHCDVPDLALFPPRYPELRDIRFGAGHEIKLLHMGGWAMSWLVRVGLLRSLQPWSRLILGVARGFDWMGSNRSGFHMILRGEGADGAPRERLFQLIARQGHGPAIPCMPAILLARRLARGLATRGAMPCLDLIDLPDYLAGLEGLDITVLAEDA